MKRLSDKKFIEMKPDMDKVVAIRIKNGDFYFIGWMEEAEQYSIQIADDINKCMLDRSELIVNGNVYEAITHCNGYDNLRYVWEKDSTGNLINTDDRKYDNAYQRFLSFVKCYERNGVASENDHDILLISEDEISNVSDLLRDGDYVWIVESVDA